MRPADTSDLWWRTAVIYCLDIETFQDSDGDGIGDIEGLCDRIDYLSELGVNCLWLMPFQPTRDLDDGYDITDFTGVDPRLGDLGGFVELLRIAHDRGIRVIMDLVVNHTSDRHPWFRSARRSRNSKHRNYYVWRDRPPRTSQKTVFPGEEDGIWEHDERTDQYYLHSFYSHQPDLNLGEPAVRAEIARIIGFWTELGVDGFRVDAVPFLIAAPGAADETDPHEFLQELRRFVGRRRAGAVLLGEVALPHDEQLAYFGSEGPELELQFDFATMQATFLSLVRHDANPLAKVLGERPVVDRHHGWAMFLRNHDELTLQQLPEKEQQEIFEALAPDERQRVYGRGIVRRLAPMLHGDPRRIRQAYSVLFSLPGAPTLFYGEEIGMGELPGMPARAAVRTPMQWEGGPAGGFSTARPSRLPEMPPGGYAPELVNVHDQLRDPDSLLSFIRLLIARYRSAPEIAWGELSILDTGDPAVMAHAVAADGVVFVAVHNFAEDARRVQIEIPGSDEDSTVADLLSDAPVDPVDAAVVVDLDGYGFRWLRRVSSGARRS